VKDVSVIIINYNTAALTCQCIQSVLQHTTQLDHEVIVVDNHSAERTIINVVAQFPSVKLIQLDENIGFGKANNIAVKQAKGKYLFLLNPDTIIQNDVLFLFHKFYEANAQQLSLSVIGAELVDVKGHKIHSAQHFPTMQQYLFNKSRSLLNYVGFKIKQQPEIFSVDRFYPVDYVTGADMFMAKQLFESVGGFDPDFFLYFEESDLQYRLHLKGGKSFIIKEPSIVHLQGKSTALIRQRSSVLYLKGMMVYMKKHNTALKFGLFKIIWTILDIKTVVLQFILWVKSKRF
jgi:GT2 family glycosyltransferase